MLMMHLLYGFQGCNYNCLAIGASGSTIYAAGSDNRIKALEDDGNVGLKVAADIEASCTITQIVLPAGACRTGVLSLCHPVIQGR